MSAIILFFVDIIIQILSYFAYLGGVVDTLIFTVAIVFIHHMFTSPSTYTMLYSYLVSSALHFSAIYLMNGPVYEYDRNGKLYLLYEASDAYIFTSNFSYLVGAVSALAMLVFAIQLNRENKPDY